MNGSFCGTKRSDIWIICYYEWSCVFSRSVGPAYDMIELGSYVEKIEKHFTSKMLPQSPLKLITVVLQYDLNPHHCTIDLNTFFFRTLLQCLWENSVHVRLSRTIDQKFISKNSESDSCGSSI